MHISDNQRILIVMNVSIFSGKEEQKSLSPLIENKYVFKKLSEQLNLSVYLYKY